jgi:hypothetical protein
MALTDLLTAELNHQQGDKTWAKLFFLALWAQLFNGDRIRSTPPCVHALSCAYTLRWIMLGLGSKVH